MCANRYGLPTLAILLLGVGCSSKDTKSGTDASAGEAGKGSDGKSSDAKADASGIDGRSADTRDTRGIDGSALDGGAKDAPAGDATKDVALDRALDTAKVGDGSLIDQAIDTTPIPNGSCALPFDIPSTAVHSDITVDTSQADHVLDFPCVGNGGDIVLRFVLSDREMVYADTFGTPWNTALLFSDSCETLKPPLSPDMEICNDDACGTTQSQAFAILGYGRHYLLVSGANDESGPVTVHFERSPIGNGPFSKLPVGTDIVEGTTSGISGTPQCEASGPENSYWWIGCPDYVGGDFYASTCGGAGFDTVLSLQIPRSQVLMCNDDDDACGMQSTLSGTVDPGAGINLLTVDSSTGSNFGKYSLSYTRP